MIRCESFYSDPELMSKVKGAIPHRARLIEELRNDPKLARAYLAAATKDRNARVMLAALRTVAEARGKR